MAAEPCVESTQLNNLIKNKKLRVCVHVCVCVYVCTEGMRCTFVCFLGFSGISKQWKVGYLKFWMLINHLFKEHVSVFTSIRDFL